MADANLAIPILPFLHSKYKIYKGLNAPISGSYTFIIEAIGDSTTIFSQRAICTYTTINESVLGNMYVRHCNNGVWTAWEQIISIADIPYKLRTGTISIETGAKWASRAISFSGFSSPPEILITPKAINGSIPDNLSLSVEVRSGGSAVIYAFAKGDVYAFDVSWVAIGN